MDEQLNRKNMLSSETFIPIVWVGTIIIVLIGGILWLTEIRGVAVANKDSIKRIEQEVTDINETRAAYRTRIWESIRSQDKRLARIEGKIDILIQNRNLGEK